MELYIIRHGETDENLRKSLQGITDNSLNETGKNQAALSAKKLNGVKFDSAFSSPLKRASETFAIINKTLELKTMIYDDDLKERNFGVFDGLSMDEIRVRYPEEYELWIKSIDYEIKGSESIKCFEKRISTFSEGVKKLPFGGRYLFVTHLGVIRYMIAFLLDMPPEYSWRFRVDPGSVSRIIINEEGYAYLHMLNG